jgi:dehydrogenase/reductase SDR family member 7
MVDLNVIGVISVTTAVLKHMLLAGSGQIMTTSSIAGRLGSPTGSTYSATKHAVIGYMSALRSEVGARGVGVTLACPGPTATEITEHAFTETAGKEVGSEAMRTDGRLSAGRCAQLMTKALYYHVYEVWIASQPFLLFTYISQVRRCPRPLPPSLSVCTTTCSPLHPPAVLPLVGLFCSRTLRWA